ncbi:MAG: pilus assembly protein TadG-related protein [Victivallales bacterium]|nr:pilus assembly protein TadG-related protein [Victivallales bacterium]
MTGASSSKKNRGQVLVFALVILVILVIATLFLFDLHSIIRSKMKLETAEQSAALAAAGWQMRSLNLIGELNLVKASETLLDDIPTVGETDTEKIASAGRTLTEMQSRISFCGPLIGLGAAQQAAKNNGINIFLSDNKSSYKSIYTDFQNYLTRLDSGSSSYYADIGEYLNHYRWRDPYIAMLEAILEQGLAVRPNGCFPGLDSIDPAWMRYDDVYSAILNEMWCNPYLNAIVKYPDSYWNGKWYNISFEYATFPEESEIYTLWLDFTGTESITGEELESILDNNDIDHAAREKLEPLRWCIYDEHWARYEADGITQNVAYTGPNNDGLDYWSRGYYLRNDLKEGVFYGGPVAYAECYQHIKLISKYKSRMSSSESGDSSAVEKDQYAAAREALRNDIVRVKTGGNTLKVGNDAASDNDSAGAVAKPLGTLADGRPPTDAIIVLPVFTDAALIPGTMQQCRLLRMDLTSLEEFLKWLAEIEDLHNPGSSPPDGAAQYLTALQKLDDPAFRKSGYNNDYVRNDSDPSIYFSNSYKYDPNTNPAGAGWLQQIWVGTDSGKDETASTAISEEKSGYNTRVYSGNRYLLKNRFGVLQTNEQMICRWTPGGSTGVVPGTKIGPSHL